MCIFRIYGALYSPWDDENYPQIRYSIFCITAMSAGYPALIWAVTVLCQHYKSKGRISFIAIFLLLSDLLELIVNSILVTFTFSGLNYSSNWTFNALCFMLIAARLCGHVFHPLVTLESILTQKYPSLASLFSAPYSITLSIIMLVVVIGSQFVQPSISYQMNLLFLLFPIFLHVVNCVVTCKTSPHTIQTTCGKPGVLILSVDMFTLIILYVPFLLNCYIDVPLMFDFLVYMRLISNPFCVFSSAGKNISWQNNDTFFHLCFSLACLVYLFLCKPLLCHIDGICIITLLLFLLTHLYQPFLLLLFSEFVQQKRK